METVLTVDDAPSPDITPVLLGTFRSRSVKAAFFVVGRFAAQFPHLVEQILAAGHEVYAHSWSHTPFHQLDAASITAELDRTESVLSRLRPTPTPYPLRLPGGWGISEPSVHAAIRSWNPDSVIVQWNVSTEDWRAPVRYRIADDLALETSIRIMETIHNPGLSAPILLCHDNLIGNVRKPRELYQTFFGGLIDTFQNVGFKFGGLIK